MVFALLAGSCHQKTATSVATLTSDTAGVHFFFPVTDFIKGQLKEADSIPVTPLRITIAEEKRDSSWISKNELDSLAAPFLTPVIDSAGMHDLFSVNSFLDQTINAITLTYDPKIKLPDSLNLNHWVVYIDPELKKVQRIYLVKEQEKQGATVTTQLTWEAGKSFHIRTITEQPKVAPEVKEETVKWDFSE